MTAFYALLGPLAAGITMTYVIIKNRPAKKQ